MKYYMLSRKKEPACPMGMLDATLYDKVYDDWGSVAHGYFPWYANAGRPNLHEKLPSGLILVGRSKKYLFGARQLIRDLYVFSSNFVSACRQANASFFDFEPVDFKVSNGSEVNPLGYYVGVFESYAIEEVVDPQSVLQVDEFDQVESFSKLVIREGFSAALFRIKDFNPEVSTLFCNEIFMQKAMDNHVQGIEFLSLDECDSSSLDTI
ncbi:MULTISPECIES: hypothetical protein [Pseudomonas]|uniref:Immunity protein 43 domain-containing protein n=1 Tax=Pseudomonas taiwanensis TaxID=470150 RepID=A0ABR6V6H4_9PSED|nr:MULTISPECIES: hypothetical protein [Pseudomonas]MBC3476007.1 hypothetical protein [Pseudomonas taiwanensis]MBC3490493.1 hypothetical protein [Pseudomonas taiwanensis]MPS97600.1 hypothetical protein [Pseudomonas sp.]QQZ36330.1 hypothetical protein IF103_24640 [Pseudomonas sp. SK2]WEZ88680.1 hypothetical protein P3R38_24950 [Pseudomonas sp. NyZ480]